LIKTPEFSHVPTVQRVLATRIAAAGNRRELAKEASNKGVPDLLQDDERRFGDGSCIVDEISAYFL
jgi:hypothetical protein